MENTNKNETVNLSEELPEIKPSAFIFSWVIAGLVSTALLYLINPFLGQFQKIELVLKDGVIALTQTIVLRNYLKKAWLWAVLTFSAHLFIGALLLLGQGFLSSIYSNLSEPGTYIFIFGFDILIQVIIASVQYIFLKKEVANASRWIFISVFSVSIALFSQLLVMNIIFRFGSPTVFGSYLNLINLYVHTAVAYLISGIGMTYLLRNKIIDPEVSEEMLIEELEE
jgi:hypothetical protein